MVPDYITAVLADSPAAFWQLQDAGDFPQDSSGNGRHMDSKSVGTSLTYRNLFGPFSSFYVLPSKAAVYRSIDTVLTATDNIAMELWITGVSPVATQEIFFLGNVSGVTNATSLGSNGWGLTTNNVAHPGIRVLTGGSFLDVASTTAFASGATLEHIVIVRRSGTWEMWRNGVQDTTIGTFTATPGAYAGQVVYIGQNDSGGRALSFRIAFAALYPVALTGARIVAHYAAMTAWTNAYVELDESTSPVLPGTFTATTAQGLIPDRPYHFADYNELSWLSQGSTQIDYATGSGISVYPA